MVAPDDDGAPDLALGDEGVEEQARLVALAVAEPADARREPLKPNLGRAVLEVAREQAVGVAVAPEDPAAEPLVIREEFQQRVVVTKMSCGSPDKRGPAEGPRPSQNWGRM